MKKQAKEIQKSIKIQVGKDIFTKISYSLRFKKYSATIVPNIPFEPNIKILFIKIRIKLAPRIPKL